MADRLQRVRDGETGATIGYIHNGVRYDVKSFHDRLRKMAQSGNEWATGTINKFDDFTALRGQADVSDEDLTQELADIDQSLRLGDAEPEKKRAWRARRRDILRLQKQRGAEAGQKARTAALSPVQGMPETKVQESRRRGEAQPVRLAGGEQLARPVSKRDAQIVAVLRKVLGRDPDDNEYNDFIQFAGRK